MSEDYKEKYPLRRTYARQLKRYIKTIDLAIAPALQILKPSNQTYQEIMKIRENLINLSRMHFYCRQNKIPFEKFVIENFTEIRNLCYQIELSKSRIAKDRVLSEFQKKFINFIDKAVGELTKAVVKLEAMLVNYIAEGGNNVDETPKPNDDSLRPQFARGNGNETIRQQ